MRPLSIPCAECSVVISSKKSIMTNLASEAMNARRGDYVGVIVEFRGVGLDSDETPDDRKLTGFE
jgi:hypothetical protein